MSNYLRLLYGDGKKAKPTHFTISRKAEQPRKPAVPKRVVPPKVVSATERFWQLVAQEEKATGLPRSKATGNVVKKFPGLHTQFLAEQRDKANR